MNAERCVVFNALKDRAGRKKRGMVWRDLGWAAEGLIALTSWAQACPSTGVYWVGHPQGMAETEPSTYINHRSGPLQHDLGDHLPVAVLCLVLVTVQVRVALLLGHAAGQGTAAGSSLLQLQQPTSPSPACPQPSGASHNHYGPPG